jgi:hypothetical protein
MVRSMLQQKNYHMFLSSNTTSGPTKMDLILHVPSHSPNQINLQR